MDDKQTSSGVPTLDEERARALVGALVLIGVTRTRPGGGESLEQMFGIVASVDASGIEVTLCGTRSGEVFRLPPDLEAFHPAPPGEYRLRSTGEMVTNPEFTTTWEINQGPSSTL